MTRNSFAMLDAEDRLAAFRARFELPLDVIYLDGNSLGPVPVDTPQHLARVMRDEWGTQLIRAWTACNALRCAARGVPTPDGGRLREAHHT